MAPAITKTETIVIVQSADSCDDKSKLDRPVNEKESPENGTESDAIANMINGNFMMPGTSWTAAGELDGWLSEKIYHMSRNTYNGVRNVTVHAAILMISFTGCDKINSFDTKPEVKGKPDSEAAKITKQINV